MFCFVPLSICEKLVVAFEHVEGLVLVGMGGGRSASAGERGLCDGCRKAACDQAGDEDLYWFAKYFEGLECSHRWSSFHGENRKRVGKQQDSKGCTRDRTRRIVYGAWFPVSPGRSCTKK